MVSRLAYLVFVVLMVCGVSSARAATFSVPENPSLDVMAGQMVLVGFRGTGEAPLVEDIALLREDIRKGHIGGVILFDYDVQTKKRGRNVRSLGQVAKLVAMLQQEARIPLFIAVDQEGGRVERLRAEHGFVSVPHARALGAKKPEETQARALEQGRALRKLGINLNFAPVADVDVNPASPAIGAYNRAFSEKSGIVAAHAAAFAKGLAAAGVASSYKHFPGHGSAAADSHKSMPDITATWTEDELVPYLPGSIPADLPLMVMAGHVYNRALDPVYPATLSHAVITDVLRVRLGWKGVVVTDDLDMDAVTQHYTQEESIRLAVNAGADIILFGNNLRHAVDQGRTVHATLVQLAQQGAIPRARIQESWNRIVALKKRLYP